MAQITAVGHSGWYALEVERYAPNTLLVLVVPITFYLASFMEMVTFLCFTLFQFFNFYSLLICFLFFV